VAAEGAVAYEDLEGARLDQVDVALRFALLESVLRVRRAPVLIEEPVAALPPERRDVLQRIYAHLAQRTQVIILTPASDLEGHRVC
jgi:predicted ATPase